MKILKRCRHLESFVHVSTAFVNSNNHCDVIEEKIYRRRINYKDVEKSLKFLNDKQLAGMLSELLDGLSVWLFFKITFIDKNIKDSRKFLICAPPNTRKIMSLFKQVFLIIIKNVICLFHLTPWKIIIFLIFHRVFFLALIF